MRNFKFSVALASAVLAIGVLVPIAHADDVTEQSKTQYHDAGPGGLMNQTMSLKPQLGVLTFDDGAGGTTSRGAAGLTLDFNMNPGHAVYIGPEVGAIYSHIGDAGSNFIGTNSTNNNIGPTSSASALVLPADLKLGYAITDAVRISARGGGNVIYQSGTNALNLASSSVGSGSDWKVYPNAGGDLEFDLGRVALDLRPDWTFASGNKLFTGTVGFGFLMG